MGRNQWQDGYPNPESIATDIAGGNGYVLTRGIEVLGYCAIIFTGEPAYDHLAGGTWLTASTTSDCRYAVVHRMAINPRLWGQGLSAAFFGLVEEFIRKKGFESLRVDTNYDNTGMLHILRRRGFSYCGIVMYAAERMAFELVL